MLIKFQWRANSAPFYLSMKNTKFEVAWPLCGLLIFVILSPNVAIFFSDTPTYSVLVSEDFLSQILDGLARLLPFFQSALLELGLLAVVGRPLWWLLIQLPLFLWFPFELIYIQRYGVVSSAHIFSILQETNSDEIIGYTGHQLWLLLLGYFAWLVVLLAALLFFFRQSNVVWRHRVRWWWLAASIVLIVALVAAQTDLSRQQDNLAPEPAARELCTAAEGCSYPFMVAEMQDDYPFGLPLRLYSYFQQNNLLHEYSKQIKTAQLNLSRDPLFEEFNETWVVVIGESSRAASWSLGGYERDTNPLLSRRDRLIWFDDTVSMAANTRVAVPLLLSHTSITDLAANKFKPSWINAFKEAGFYTYWFSVQIPVGDHDTSIGIYANLADDTKFLNMGTYRSFGAYDGALLGALNSALAERHKKKLIILHTLGSHAPYQRRYPPEFDHFKPSLSRDSGIGVFDSRHKDEIRNTYDNSIRYTDYFLDQVISSLERQSGITAMWYASDHGQTLTDDGCNNVGHGFRSRNNFHIPLLFWYSKKYAELFPGVAALPQRNLKPAYMQDFYASVLGAAGFESTADLVRHQLLRPDYDSGVRFITVNGVNQTNFDKDFPAGHFCPGPS